MKRIQRRSNAALLLALLLLLGTLVLVLRLFLHGGDWAAYNANLELYTSEGILRWGTLTDRNGVLLASSEDGDYRYADDETLRLASLHAVGDYRGFTGSGAIQRYARKLTNYSVLGGSAEERGNVVPLTLDAELQKTAWRALRGRKGCVLVMNYETGEILTMVSAPAYDPLGEPDLSVDGIFLNRALSTTYTPGSVFKTVTICAAIENIPDLYERSFVCKGSMQIAGGTVKCGGVHGKQTIEQALANSCNCTFGTLAMELGGDTLSRYVRKLGFTEAGSLDGYPTAAGSFEAVETQDSYLAWSGIGQHKDLVCPYAMLRYLSAVANGGVVQEPTLLLGNSNGSTRLLREETAAAVDEMMSYTFTTHYGTSGRFPKLDLCAKTGTAELGDGTSHAWFVGYCHTGMPLAFVVCIERGGEGIREAAPVANTVLQKALEIYG
ncbi:MAG: penicillin-binding protein [Oscillospiraceae bacterium]|nr:penicillin-binding protein [Oscillospiraceae bacterium]